MIVTVSIVLSRDWGSAAAADGPSDAATAMATDVRSGVLFNVKLPCRLVWPVLEEQ